ncbi:TIGR00730 family Rossman fold protein [Halomonas halocynthiae]|uniref:LOG family protein n=1 Tax=Halomonas halocynthiae TaxID=176290 RepID=UPI0003FE4507|nr:TIGR00730 family Rossman fold protein [Halomonas halocynthiae]
MAAICVYLGSRPGNSPAYQQAAVRLGELIGQRGHSLVYGGARVGLMGELANSVMAHGGQVVGVMPDHLVEREQAHLELNELIRVSNMHERKACMADLSDAFIALPGGIGTLEELFETWTWRYLELHHKPLGLLNTERFYQPLMTFLDSTVNAGFLASETRAQLLDAATPEAMIEQIEARLTHG